MKEVRSFGQVEKRNSGRYRARVPDGQGGKITLGNFDTYEEAAHAIEEFKSKEGLVIDESIDENTQGLASKPYAEIGLDGGEISTGVLTEPLDGNWDKILIGFGLDPNEFEVLDDKVRMSKWQSSKRLENGDRDLIWLYSYKATFTRRKTPKITEEDIQELRSSIRSWKPVKPVLSAEPPSTFVVLWADWQLAKSASGGVKATIQRVLDSFVKTEQRIKDLKKLGRNIERIAFVSLGDPIEGCDGNYASQLYSVQLNQRQQLLTALDLFTTGVTALCGLAEKRTFISCLSNHGEWMRRGGKQSVTTDSDSADGFLADTLQRILKGSNAIDDWLIPHDEMSMQTNLSGVEVAFHHGHKITGKELEWLRGQSIRLLRDHGKEPRIWFTGHKHHIAITDFGAFTRFQAPSLDSDGSTNGGSKWFADTSGIWSSPGTMTLLVGNHDKKNWSDLAVL